MAITAATKNADFNSSFLPPHLAAPIFERAARTSVVQSLVPQIPLGINGEAIPYVASKVSAGWVAEGATKPSSAGTINIKTMTPKKIAAIAVVSSEVVRANPGGYIDMIKPQMAEAFAIAFDNAALHNLGPAGTGTGPFATYIDQTTKSTELGGNSQANGGIYQDLVVSLAELVNATDALGRHYRLTGWALDDQMEPRLLGQVDTTGRPIWVDLPVDNFSQGMARPGSVLGRRSFMGEGVATSTIMGYGGEWDQAVWGVVGGINYGVSDVAAVTINGSLVSLWENNLLAIRAEAEYAFLVNDVNAFIQLRNDSGS